MQRSIGYQSGWFLIQELICAAPRGAFPCVSFSRAGSLGAAGQVEAGPCSQLRSPSLWGWGRGWLQAPTLYEAVVVLRNSDRFTAKSVADGRESSDTEARRCPHLCPVPDMEVASTPCPGQELSPTDSWHPWWGVPTKQNASATPGSPTSGSVSASDRSSRGTTAFSWHGRRAWACGERSFSQGRLLLYVCHDSAQSWWQADGANVAIFFLKRQYIQFMHMVVYITHNDFYLAQFLWAPFQTGLCSPALLGSCLPTIKVQVIPLTGNCCAAARRGVLNLVSCSILQLHRAR